MLSQPNPFFISCNKLKISFLRKKGVPQATWIVSTTVSSVSDYIPFKYFEIAGFLLYLKGPLQFLYSKDLNAWTGCQLFIVCINILCGFDTVVAAWEINQIFIQYFIQTSLYQKLKNWWFLQLTMSIHSIHVGEHLKKCQTAIRVYSTNRSNFAQISDF